jgi:orotidine-5'-phosphate decarboxylase
VVDRNSFLQRLLAAQADASPLCIGLDPDPSRLPVHLFSSGAPADAVMAFNEAVIEATSHVVCAYKINFAFYEALGSVGFRVIRDTIRLIPDGTLVIADVKRGDIGHSAMYYAKAVFDKLNCDACTVSPYMGRDSVMPFLDFPGRAAFVLARTSNSGAEDVQERVCGGEPMYLRVAKLVNRWNEEAEGTAGLVVGATAPEALVELRAACPELPFLVPGIGAQGGSPFKVMQLAATPQGAVIVNSSRSIIYASSGEDFAEAAAQAAAEAADVLKKALME